MPNGLVIANKGVYYTDKNGTNGAWRWIKTTDNTNTGWKVVYGDTGWLDISKYFNTALSATAGKIIKIRRVNDTVMVQFHGTLGATRGALAITPNNLLAGFIFASRRDIPGAATITMQVNASNISVYGNYNTNDASVNHMDSMAFTDSAWPTNLADF